MSSNRFAGRDLEQFIIEIKEETLIEKELMERIKRYYKQEYDKDLIVENNGVDNTGEYVKEGEVTLDADFRVNGKLFEVKHHKGDLKRFRMKCEKIESYVEQDAYIALINGYCTDNPRFTIIKPRKIYRMMMGRTIYHYPPWENQIVMNVKDSEFKWHPLPELKEC